MLLSLLLTAAPLALASTHLNVLQARQGSEAFRPSTGNIVTNCQNPCGEDICLRPERGDTCCVEGYGCPGGSFCLTQGYCCPNGDDPATCARQFGVTLPSGFVPGQTVGAGVQASPATSSPAPVATAPSATSVIVAPTLSSAPVATTPSTTTAIVAPTLSSAPAVYYPIPSNATAPILPSPSATGAQNPSGVSFTGGATAVRYTIGAGIVGALGMAAALIW